MIETSRALRVLAAAAAGGARAAGAGAAAGEALHAGDWAAALRIVAVAEVSGFNEFSGMLV